MPVWREGGDGYVGIFIFETFVPNIWSTRVADSAETMVSHFCRSNQILDRRMSLRIDHRRCDHAVVHTLCT